MSPDHARSGHQALRRGRVSLPGQIYLITTVADGRQPFFADWIVGRLVVNQLRQLEGEGLVVSLAWVLMPDHLHWLLQLPADVDLGDVVKRLKGRSARLVNRTLGRRGAIWSHGYHDHALRREQDVRAVARYIVANPLRAGLVESVGDYPLWDAVWL